MNDWDRAMRTFGTESTAQTAPRFAHVHRWEFVERFTAPNGPTGTTAISLNVMWSLSHCKGCGQSMKAIVAG